MNTLLKVGDLVQMVRGFSIPGIILGEATTFGGGIHSAYFQGQTGEIESDARWIWVEWPDQGRSLEKSRDLEKIT